MADTKVAATQQPNPYTIPAVTMGVTVIGSSIATVHAATAQPDHFNLAVGAVCAAIGGFLYNLNRQYRHQDTPR